MKKTRSMLVGIAIVLCLALTAATWSAEKGTPENPWVIGMSQCNLGEPWRVQMNADIKSAADAAPSIKVIYKDAQNDTLRQRAHIEEFIGQGVDLLIVSPKEAAPLTPIIRNAYTCLLYTSPSPRDRTRSRMPSSA